MGVLFCGAGLVLALWGGDGRSSGEFRSVALGVLAPPSLSADLSVNPAPAREPEHAPRATSDPPREEGRVGTAREFLAGYYGREWPEIEAKIEAAGQDLDLAYSFTPWEEVESRFLDSLALDEEQGESIVRAQLRWPEQTTPEFIRDEFLPGGQELGEADLLEIEALVAEPNGEIEELARRFVDGIEFYVHEKWLTGRYLRAPFTTAGLSGERGFHSQSHGGYGWAVTITLTREDHPDMQALEQTIQARCMARDHLVLDHLRKRYGR